jgi:hypothetical protein
MSQVDPIAMLFGDLHEPVAPHPAFADALRDQLLTELRSPAAAGWRRPIRSVQAVLTARPRSPRRLALLAAAVVLLLAGIAAATYLVLAHGGAGAQAELPTAAPPTVPSRLAEREPVQIDLGGGPRGGNPSGGGGSFTLRRAGGTSDTGTITYSVVFERPGTTAAGQPYAHVRALVYLNGKDGTIVLVVTGRTFGAEGSGANDGQDVWIGQWRVVSGDGRYTGAGGKGSFAGIAGPAASIALRLNGYLY